MMLHVTAVCLFVLAAVALASAGESQCYVCSSYMEQCKERVHVNKDYVHKTKCKSACFVRRGDDDALYRGCFDGFMKVEELKNLRTFVGCTNQTWNNRELPWCLCKGDLCNAESLYTLGYQGSTGKRVVNAGYAKEGPAAPVAAVVKEEYYYPDQHYEAPFQAEAGYEATASKNSVRREPYPQKQPQQHQQQQYPQQQYPQQQQYEPEAAYQTEYLHQPVQYHGQQYQYPSELQYPEEQAYVVEQQVDVNHAADPYYNAAYAQQQQEEGGEYRLDDFVEHLKQGNEEEELYGEDGGADYDPYRQPRIPHEYEENQVQEDYPPEALYEDTTPTKAPEAFPQHLAARIQCAKTGFYQNPDDCRTFVACILDPHYRMPYMHLMRCPDGLVWDNADKICMDYSTTCNIGGSPAPAQVEPQEADYYGQEQEPAAYYDTEANDAEAVGLDYYEHDDTAAAAHNVEAAAVQEPAYYEPIDASYQPK